MRRTLQLSSFLFATMFLAALSRADFSYSDFTSVAGLQLNGDAAQAGSDLRLANASSSSSGSVFTTDQVELGVGNSFSTYFQFQIDNEGGVGDSDGAGADGLVFVVQTASNNVGGAGGGIGYAGITPSLGVEFDTYNNGSSANDPDGNHVGIDLNGSIASAITSSEPVRFNNGEIWNAWIDYDGNSNQLEVRWAQSTTRPAAASLSYAVDLAIQLGQDTAFVGFTSATGAGWGDHDLLRWEYRGEFSPFIPEPASGVIAALAAVALCGWKVRARIR